MFPSVCQFYRGLAAGILVVLLSACNDQPSAAPPKSPADMVLIPAGAFIMGSDKVDTSGKKEEYGLVKPLYLDEHPRRRLELPAFLMDKYEVSNAQYKDFVRETRRAEPFEWTQNGYNLLKDRLNATDVEALRWIAEQYFKLDMDTRKMSKPLLLKAILKQQRYMDTLPATGVGWQDANDYCQWRGKVWISSASPAAMYTSTWVSFDSDWRRAPMARAGSAPLSANMGVTCRR